MFEKVENFSNHMTLINPYLNPIGFSQHLFNPNLEPNNLDSPVAKYLVNKDKGGDVGTYVIGNYTIKKIDVDKYSVSANNGKCGAKICSYDEVLALYQQEGERLSNGNLAIANYNKACINMQK